MTKGSPAPIRELCFGKRRDGSFRVSINLANSYEKSLEMANRLLTELEKAIPFKYRVLGGPTIVVLGGDMRKGMLSIEMVIQPIRESTRKTAARRLLGKGFSNYQHPSIT